MRRQEKQGAHHCASIPWPPAPGPWPQFFMTCLAAAALCAQVEPSSTVIHVDTRVVVCHATVVDKSGHLLTGLPKEVFTVLENGVKQEIRVFKREDIPVSMGLVIDNSGSMRNKLDQVKAASLALVE